MKDNITKSILTAVLTIIFSRIGIVVIPIFLLLLSSIFDYVTGICAAKYRNQEISSDVGKKGIYKKLAMFSIIIACFLVDVLIIYGCVVLDVNVKFYFVVTTLVSILLFLNEIISILENIKDIGSYIPNWLLPFIKNVHSKVEEAAEEVTTKNLNSIAEKQKEE